MTVDSQTVSFGHDANDRRVATTRPDGTHIRYFNRWAESRDGRLIKYYWVGDRLFASNDVPGVAFSDAPPVIPVPAWLLRILIGLFGTALVLIVVGPGARERRILIWIGPARAGAVSAVVVLAPATVMLSGCGGDPVFRHFHLDHLGSVMAKTDLAGNPMRQIRYRAYGEVRGRWTGTYVSTLASDADRFEWTGYESLHAEGIVYAGARFYDAAVGQFLSHDPLRQYASPYAYGPGDPVNGTDPTGMGFWADVRDFFSGFFGGFRPQPIPMLKELDLVVEPLDTGSSAASREDGFATRNISAAALSQSDASLSSSNVAGGGLVGAGGALLYSTAYENNPTRGGQARLGAPNPASRYGWDRTFHVDFDNRSGYHFNADIGPLQRFNHARIPGSLYRLGSTSVLRGLGRASVVGGLAFDAFDLATAGPGGYGRAVGGIAGGWGGALGGAAIGSAIAPGPGTVIGGFLGGVCGSVGGQYVGDEY